MLLESCSRVLFHIALRDEATALRDEVAIHRLIGSKTCRA